MGDYRFEQPMPLDFYREGGRIAVDRAPTADRPSPLLEPATSSGRVGRQARRGTRPRQPADQRATKGLSSPSPCLKILISGMMPQQDRHPPADISVIVDFVSENTQLFTMSQLQNY